MTIEATPGSYRRVFPGPFVVSPEVPPVASVEAGTRRAAAGRCPVYGTQETLLHPGGESGDAKGIEAVGRVGHISASDHRRGVVARHDDDTHCYATGRCPTGHRCTAGRGADGVYRSTTRQDEDESPDGGDEQRTRQPSPAHGIQPVKPIPRSKPEPGIEPAVVPVSSDPV